MTGYPFTYADMNGVPVVATYRAADWRNYRPSRVSLERADGKPLTVGTRVYPAGYVAGHGDAFAESFRDSVALYVMESVA